MKDAYVLALVLALVVVAVLALAWPMSCRSTQQVRIESVKESVEIAEDIESMQVSVGKDLERAKALVAAAAELQKPVTLPEANPFELQLKEVAEALGPQQTAVAQPEEAEAVVPEIGVEDIFHKEDQWPVLALSGIVLDGRGALAIINGDVLRLGSVVEGLQVAEITKGQVTLVSPQSERRVLLLEGWEQPKEGK